MRHFLLTRLTLGAGVIFFVSILAFGLLRWSGDLALEYAGENATPAEIETVRREFGLDRPLAVQYADWLKGVITLNPGESVFTREPVMSMIATRLVVTGQLAGLSLILALLLAIPLGVASAYWTDRWVVLVERAVVTIGQAVPSFWLALMLAGVFGLHLGWLPVAGSDSFAHFILPSLTLAVAVMPALTRVTKTGMKEALASNYVRTAQAKGLSTGRILLVHALPNALLPVVSLTAVQLGQLLAGSVVIETVFSLDGVGRLALLSIERVDYPVVQAIVLCLSVAYVVLTLLSDVINRLIDPRLRVSA